MWRWPIVLKIRDQLDEGWMKAESTMGGIVLCAEHSRHALGMSTVIFISLHCYLPH